MLIDPKKTLFINSRGPVGAAVKEAPVDGKPYVRKNGEWSEAATSEGGSGFSGDYNDLTNKPNIPSDVSDLTDNSNLLGQGGSGEDNVQSDWIESDNTSDAYIKNKPTLFSGNYNDLTNKPTIPSDIKTPINVSPLNESTDVIEIPTLVGSTFYSLYGMEMVASQWQISTTNNFETLTVDTGDIIGNFLSWVVTPGVLSTNTTYFWRVRYKDEQGTYSDWSLPTTFQTESVFSIPSYVGIPNPTPANLGEFFEGGYYAGMIWNQLIQSTDIKELKTGQQVFNVPNMDGNPIVYIGQTVEVRSRANPYNKFIGTVVFAGSTKLILNINSINGSGTYDDWSVMGKYRIIVSPKSSGETTSKIKNNTGALPIECATVTEGFVATKAMKNSGNATEYPCAHWARGLNINGYTDWYIPSRDELEICYRTFKPENGNNTAVAFREFASIDYTTNGSYGDVVNNIYGTNNNSIPNNIGYTLSDPSQTTTSLFRVGGSEAFSAGAGIYYLTVSEYPPTSVYMGIFDNNPNRGRQIANGRNNNRTVRAIRRSII